MWHVSYLHNDAMRSHETSDAVERLVGDIGYNPLTRVHRSYRPLVASGLIDTLKKQWADSWGARMEHLLRYAVLALLDQPRADIRDIVRLYVDKDFRKVVVAGIVDEQIRHFWTKEFPNMNYMTAIDGVAPIANKLGAFLANPIIRRIVCEPEQPLRFRSMMDQGEVLIVNLAKGRIGVDMATRHNHTYRGLFRCGYCNGPMVPELQKGHVYYRCKTTGCLTKTVREEMLTEAIEASLRLTELSAPDMADFNVRLQAWITGDEDQAWEKSWHLRQSNLADRIDRLTDALVERLIDRDAYAERRKRLGLEEETLAEERRMMAKRDEKAAHISTLAELANSLVSSLRLADSAEKRRLVEMTTSNRRVCGKDIYLKPSDWLFEIENTVGVLSGAPDRDRDRRG